MSHTVYPENMTSPESGYCIMNIYHHPTLLLRMCSFINFLIFWWYGKLGSFIMCHLLSYLCPRVWFHPLGETSGFSAGVHRDFKGVSLKTAAREATVREWWKWSETVRMQAGILNTARLCKAKPAPDSGDDFAAVHTYKWPSSLGHPIHCCYYRNIYENHLKTPV